MKSVFDQQDVDELMNRIQKLSPDSQPQWGKMSVGQMLAHCNVTYEMVYTDKHPKATGIKRFLLKTFLKNPVCNEKPYPKNSRTAPQFLITTERVFETEKGRLIDFIRQTQENGKAYFEGRESNSFGSLTAQEWNNMFYKHLDHHLNQFGV
jgi:hypothetical protein